MSTLYSNQSSNIRKTWLLVSVFLIVIIGIGYFLSYYYGSPGILYIAIIFSIFANIGSYWFSDKIVLSLSHAKEVKGGEFLEIHRILENLSISAHIPKPRLYVIDDSAPNAFATGRNKEHSAVAVTTGLLSILEKTELEGVLAHELSHIGNRDILLSTMVAVMVGLVAITSDSFMRSHFFGFHGRDNRDMGRAGAILLIIGLIFMILSPIIAMLIQLAISRKREFLADATGALMTRYPEGLANALRKISSYSSPMKHAHNATAHLFISNPFGAKAMRGISKLFMTHPSVEDRIKALIGHL